MRTHEVFYFVSEDGGWGMDFKSKGEDIEHLNPDGVDVHVTTDEEDTKTVTFLDTFEGEIGVDLARSLLLSFMQQYHPGIPTDVLQLKGVDYAIDYLGAMTLIRFVKESEGIWSFSGTVFTNAGTPVNNMPLGAVMCEVPTITEAVMGLTVLRANVKMLRTAMDREDEEPPAPTSDRIWE